VPTELLRGIDSVLAGRNEAMISQHWQDMAASLEERNMALHKAVKLGARLRGPWLCHPWPCHPWLCHPWLCHLDALQAAGPIGAGINRGLVFSNAGHVAAQLDVKKASAGLGFGWSLGLLYCYNRGNTKGQEPIACGNKILRKSAPFICFLARDYFFR
jgi:hypothetical protein